MKIQTTSAFDEFPDDMTLGEARRILRERADDDWVECPTCGNVTRVYHRRAISAMQAVSLVKMYCHERDTGEIWMDRAEVCGNECREEHKLRYWGLLQPQGVKRSTGGSNGVFRLTGKGKRFVEGVITVPRYAEVMNNHTLALWGDEVGIRQCLGTKYDYEDLLASGPTQA